LWKFDNLEISCLVWGIKKKSPSGKFCGENYLACILNNLKDLIVRIVEKLTLF
jgi:hypothetical protein